MADSKCASAAAETALVAYESKKAGRSKGTTGIYRTPPYKFDTGVAMKALKSVASKAHHPKWNWNGLLYPKIERSHGPNPYYLN